MTIKFSLFFIFAKPHTLLHTDLNMVVISKSFSAATVSLKIGTLMLFICLIVYVVGFTVARWATITFSNSENAITIQTFYHAGLWLHCGCVDLGEISCVCHSRGGDPGMFQVSIDLIIIYLK